MKDKTIAKGSTETILYFWNEIHFSVANQRSSLGVILQNSHNVESQYFFIFIFFSVLTHVFLFLMFLSICCTILLLSQLFRPQSMLNYILWDVLVYEIIRGLSLLINLINSSYMYVCLVFVGLFLLDIVFYSCYYVYPLFPPEPLLFPFTCIYLYQFLIRVYF